MRFCPRMLLLCFGALAVSACATGGSSVLERANVGRYEAAAGNPVPSFRFSRIDTFDVVGDHSLAVWEGQRKAWLLTLESPCDELRWSVSAALGVGPRRVYARTDSVAFTGAGGAKESCRIQSIRPLDVSALRLSERESRQASR